MAGMITRALVRLSEARSAHHDRATGPGEQVDKVAEVSE